MRKRTKRKVVKLMNPISLAIEGATIPRQDKLDELRVRELAAIDAFAIGKGHLQAWHDMRTMVLVCREMAIGQVGPEAIPACDKALEIMARGDTMIHPAEDLMTMPEEAIEAIKDVFAFHDLQRQSISRAEYERFIRKTLARARSQPRT